MLKQDTYYKEFYNHPQTTNDLILIDLSTELISFSQLISNLLTENEKKFFNVIENNKYSIAFSEAVEELFKLYTESFLYSSYGLDDTKVYKDISIADIVNETYDIGINSFEEDWIDVPENSIYKFTYGNETMLTVKKDYIFKLINFINYKILGNYMDGDTIENERSNNIKLLGINLYDIVEFNVNNQLYNFEKLLTNIFISIKNKILPTLLLIEDKKTEEYVYPNYWITDNINNDLIIRLELTTTNK